MTNLNLSKLKLDKLAFVVSSLHEPLDELDYWLEKTPQERLEALEIMRQTLYGYDPNTARLQRILTVIKPYL